MSGIFISYRRSTSKHLARSIFMALQQRGHDVFLDVNNIDSGAFDGIILNQIAARPHFLLVLSTGALERCANEGDWLRREIEEAFRLNRNIVPIFDEGYDLNREIGYLPEPIRTQLPLKNAPPYSHYYFDAFIQTLSDRFFKDKVDNLPVIATPPAERAEVQKRIEQAAQPEVKQEVETTKPAQPLIWGVENILPQPFEWVYIPPGNVTINNQNYSVSTFNIGKYPITNAQFEVFIQADDGYRNPNWWNFDTDARLWRDHNKLPLPRAFFYDDHPRANINYYEAVAFCNWLDARFNSVASNLFHTIITLPTERQWVRAAQGDDKRKYPWGNEFKPQFCNTEESRIRRTTPVTQYPYGASPYGVMDMTGNVWEWSKRDSLVIDSACMCGGSWLVQDKQIDDGALDIITVTAQSKDTGFRIVLMNTQT